MGFVIADYDFHNVMGAWFLLFLVMEAAKELPQQELVGFVVLPLVLALCLLAHLVPARPLLFRAKNQQEWARIQHLLCFLVVAEVVL